MSKKNPEQCMKDTVKHRECVVCGKGFDVTYPHFQQKTCSPECRAENDARRSRAFGRRYYKTHKPNSWMHPQRIPCRRCGKEFTALYTQKYCEECLNAPEWYMQRLRDYRKAT